MSMQQQQQQQNEGKEMELLPSSSTEGTRGSNQHDDRTSTTATTSTTLSSLTSSSSWIGEGAGGHHIEVEISSIYREADKTSRLRLLTFDAPFMRNFHLAWFGFMTSFIACFSIQPLLPLIKDTLQLSTRQIHYSHLAAVSTTLFARIIMGPLCDRYGPKTTMSHLLFLGAIPLLFMSLVDSYATLLVVRALVGILGAAFVMAQAWTTAMFKRSVVGSANAIVAGWGNLGGGLAQVLMVSLYAALIRWGDGDVGAWRHAFIFPAVLCMVVAVLIHYLGTDTPRGDVAQLEKAGEVPVKAKSSLQEAAVNYMTWILAIQYAASFGVEIVVFNMAASYFHDEFRLSVVKAGHIATLCGITNLFARWFGGYLSDQTNRRMGLRGRVATQFFLVFFEAVLLVWFSHAVSLHQATALLLACSIFVQAANGSCFALVPYLSRSGGSVMGLVSAGGNAGAIIFTLLFLVNHHQPTVHGFQVMGWCVLLASFSLWFLSPTALLNLHNDPLDCTDTELEKEGIPLVLATTSSVRFDENEYKIDVNLPGEEREGGRRTSRSNSWKKGPRFMF